MESAPELISFTERWMPSWFADFDQFVEVISHHPGTRFIGPDPNEWWEGFEKISVIGRAQFSEMATLGEARIDAHEIVAWKEGTVGWVAVNCSVSLGELIDEEARVTLIVHEEGAYWKIVHVQLAFTVSNEEAVGLELTTVVDELLLLVQRSKERRVGKVTGVQTCALPIWRAHTGRSSTFSWPSLSQMKKPSG